jgi:hypothetical protein
VSSGTAVICRREPPNAMEHGCPLCGGRFANEQHCSVCPMTNYCHILCCPNCGYTFVERSSLIDFARRIVARITRAFLRGGRRISNG